MEEEQLNQPNKYLTYLKNNKYNLYFVIALFILFSMIIAMIALTINHKNTSSSNTPVNANPTQADSQLSPSSSYVAPTINGPIITPDPTQEAVIENQTQPQITPAVPFTYTHVVEFGNNWATAALKNPDIIGGPIIMKKINGSWKIVAGPGTYFPAQLLQSIGAPQELIDSFNPSSVSVSPSPTPMPGDVQ
jgi:hypothetical protein